MWTISKSISFPHLNLFDCFKNSYVGHLRVSAMDAVCLKEVEWKASEYWTFGTFHLVVLFIIPWQHWMIAIRLYSLGGVNLDTECTNVNINIWVMSRNA